ncbi:MAG: ABC transporter substrate-binding protein, partial [Rhodospirillaceae bacterium]|nr:ABC transporter substrate-binding protein [Rhodospirillaceae bacterium]
MKPVFKLAMAAAFGLALVPSGASAQKVTLNVITAGDQNMVDYVKDYLGPIFEKQMPNVSISSVGTGP